MATVRDLMTENPCAITVTQTLAEALSLMHENGVRHLPVLRGGELVGVVSEHDLALMGALPNVDATQVTVERALGAEPYSVTPETPLVDVIRSLSQRHTDSAIVVEGERVVGIVTTTDCLRCLFDHLQTSEAGSSLRPSAVRQRILEEHRSIGRRLDEMMALVEVDGDVDERRLAVVTRAVVERVESHLRLEDRILAPALRETAGFGEVRAQQLLAHHDELRAMLNGVSLTLDSQPLDSRALIESALRLAKEVREDLARENAELLGPNLLKDDPINVDFGG